MGGFVDFLRDAIRFDPIGRAANDWTEQLAADNPWIVSVAGGVAGWWSFGVGSLAVAYVADRYVKPLMAKPGKPSLPGGGAPNVAIGGFEGGGFEGFGGMGDGYNTSQAYAWSPQTIQQQGIAVPKYYGTFKAFGNIIAGYTEFVGDKNYLNVLIALGLGPIDGISDIKINDQPVAHFSEVTTDTRLGHLHQTAIPNFNDTKAEFGSSVKVTCGNPYEYQTVGDNFNFLEVMITFPGGLCHMGDSGDLEALGVQIVIAAVNLSGGAPFNIAAETIFESKSSTVSRTYRSVELSPGRYEIQITRVTEDHTTSRYQSDMYFSGVREVYTDDFEYPCQALLSVRALAQEQLSGSLNVSCLVRGARVWTYDGSTWTFQYSENPAWVGWDILTQPLVYYPGIVDERWPTILRYDGMDPDDLVLADFKAWADYCDVLGPLSKRNPAQEKRFTFNGCFDTISSLWDTFVSFCGNYHAHPVIRGTKIGLIIETTADPVQLFTEGNIEAGSFKESFIPSDQLANEYEVTFVNAENDYQQETFSVLDYETLEPPRKNALNLVGITKFAEAWKHARQLIEMNKRCRRVIEFVAKVDAVECKVGQVFNFQHNLPAWGEGGRIVSATSNSVTLDKTVTLAAGVTYSVIIRLSDDTMVTKTVTNSPGNVSVLTISGTFSVVPAQYDIYALTTTIKPFRATEIQRLDEFSFKITGLEYDANVYQPILGGPIIPVPNYSTFNFFPPVTNIVLDELIIKGQDGALQDVIDVYFVRPIDFTYDHAEIWIQAGSSAPWKYAGITRVDRLRIYSVAINQLYNIAVVTVNTSGRRAAVSGSPQASITTLGLLDPPSNVTGFTGSQNGKTVTFSWNHIEDADLWGYEIRIGPYSWESANAVIKLQSADRYDLPVEFDGTYRYWVKAIDTSGIYSSAAAHVDLTITGTESDLNFLVDAEKVTENSPSAPDGTLVKYAWDSGENALVFTPTNTGNPATDLVCSFETEDIQVADVPRTGTIRLLATVDATTPAATNQTYPTRTNRTYPGDTNQHITAIVQQGMEYAVSDTSPATTFHPYTTPITGSFKYFRARHTVTVDSYDSEVELAALRCSVDLPGVKAAIQGLTIADSTGTDVTFSTYGLDFYAPPSIQATVSYGSGSASAVALAPDISSITADGCHVNLVDISGAKRSGKVNLQLEGY